MAMRDFRCQKYFRWLTPSKSKIATMVCILYQLSLAMVHLTGVKHELPGWLSRTEFNSKFCLTSEVHSCEAFSRIDTQLDFSMKFSQAQRPITLQN